MNILITGGAGFIGVNAALHYAKQGWDVSVLDNFSRRGTNINADYLAKNAPQVRVQKGDILSQDDLKQAFTSTPDVVLHLAGQVAVTTSVADPRSDFEANALGTFNVLEAVRTYAPNAMVIFASTNKVYGGLENISVTEKDQRYAFADSLIGIPETQSLDFHSPYGCSKGAADQYVHDYARIFGLKTVVFRQSCIYGAHQMGIEDQGWVAWFLLAARFGRPITIYGNGKQVRDLLSVHDLLRAYDAAIERSDIAAGKAYNIGGGSQNTLSLLEFLGIMQKDFGLTINPAHGDVRPGDQPIFVSDNSKLKQELGWEPTVNAHTGIRALLEWLDQNKEALASLYN